MNVLIVNNYTIGDCNPVGYTMKNMLLGMPDVNWLQYCVDYREKEHLKFTEVLFNDVNDSLSYKLKAKNSDDSQPHTPVNQSGSTSKNVNPNPATLPAAVNFDKKGDILRAVFYSMPCKVSTKNLARIKEFNPDLIYTMGENIRVINQAVKLSKILNIPIVFHCMDDFKSTTYTSSPVAKIFNRHLKARLKRLNRCSVYNLGICEKMAKYYSGTYKKPYSFASNCALQFNEEPYVPREDGITKIIFSGSLHFHRGETLGKVAEVIDRLNENGNKIELEIYAHPSHIAACSGFANKTVHTKWLPFVPEEEKIKNLASADILLHVESFDEKDIEFMKYSFSTKLVEYFASARCVVGLGSKEISSIEFIDSHDCGMAAENFEELEKVLGELSKNPGKRIECGKASLAIAKEIFGKEATQKRIYDVFCEAVKNK